MKRGTVSALNVRGEGGLVGITLNGEVEIMRVQKAAGFGSKTQPFSFP